MKSAPLLAIGEVHASTVRSGTLQRIAVQFGASQSNRKFV
jgi:hypothetical protein